MIPCQPTTAIDLQKMRTALAERFQGDKLQELEGEPAAPCLRAAAEAARQLAAEGWTSRPEWASCARGADAPAAEGELGLGIPGWQRHAVLALHTSFFFDLFANVRAARSQCTSPKPGQQSTGKNGESGRFHTTRLASGGGGGESARMSLKGGNSPSTLAVPVRGRDSRLAAKERAAAKERSADQRRVKAAARTAHGTWPASGQR